MILIDIALINSCLYFMFTLKTTKQTLSFDLYVLDLRRRAFNAYFFASNYQLIWGVSALRRRGYTRAVSL